MLLAQTFFDPTTPSSKQAAWRLHQCQRRLSTRVMSGDGEILLVITICFVLLSFACVTLRIVGRVGEFHTLHRDDWTILVAWILCLSTGILASVWVFEGAVGWPATTVPPQQIVTFFKYFYALEIMYGLSITAAKVSILFLYMRIFDTIRFRVTAWTTFALVIAWLVASVSAVIWQCDPMRGAWDNEVPAKCLDKQDLFWGSGISNLALDVIILCLPIPLIWNLRLNKQRKVALTGIFLTGSLVCVSSILRITTFGVIKTADFTLTIYKASLWSIIESNVAVIAACLPTFGPLIHRMYNQPTLHATPRYDPELSALSGASISGGIHGVPRKVYDPYVTDMEESKRTMSIKMGGWRSAVNEAYAEVESMDFGVTEAESSFASDDARRKRSGLTDSRKPSAEMSLEGHIFVTKEVTVSGVQTIGYAR